MSSSLFQRPQQGQKAPAQNNELAAAVEMVKRQIGSQNPNAVLEQMCRNDPQVRAFVQSLQHMNPMQLAAQFFGRK